MRIVDNHEHEPTTKTIEPMFTDQATTTVFVDDQCKMALQLNVYKVAVLSAFLFINGTCSLFERAYSSKTLPFTLDSQLRMFSCFKLEMHGRNFGYCCLQLIVTRYI